MSASKGNRSTLPPLADLAAELRDGHDLGDVAVAVGITADQLRYRLNAGGWDSHGEPMGEDRPRREFVVGFLQGDTSWMTGALCAEADPDLFHGDHGKGVKEAKALCSRCDVREACAAWATETGESWGVWGGTDRTKRRKRKGSAA